MNKEKILTVLKNGGKVFWVHEGYKVFAQNEELFVIFIDNSYMTKLQQSEFTECFEVK